MREETTSPPVSQTQNHQNHQNHQNSGSMLKHFLSPEKHGAPSAIIWGQSKSPAEAGMMWTSWRGAAAARGRRSNEDIYLPSRRARTPSARAPNIDQRRRQSPAAQRSNSILSEERRRNYRAGAERTDHLHSRLLIADNHRMKNGRKSSRRRQWCWLNVRSAESTLKRQVLNHSPCFHVSTDVWLNTRPDVRRLHPRWHLPVAAEAETELRKLLEMIRDSS